MVKFSSRDQVPPGRNRSLQPPHRSVFPGQRAKTTGSIPGSSTKKDAGQGQKPWPVFFFPVVRREGVELPTGRRGESPPARRMDRREAVADAAIEPERAAGPAVRADVADDRLRYRFHAGEVRQLHLGPGRSRGASTIGGDIGRRRSLGTQRAKAPACRVNGCRRAAKASAKVNLRSSSKRITATPLACLAKRNTHSHNISE